MTIAATEHGRYPQPNERRHLTVMFCDVVGSTRLSRQRDVESYFSLLRAYYDACQPVVERHGGFVVQHHGDGIYVWFGYPRAAEDDAVRAVRARPLAFGHTPNLAAKLQQSARPGTMVVSDALLRMVEKAVDVVPLPDAILPDGSVVPVYEIVKEKQRAGRIGRAWRTPLIGREHERERLEQAWRAVQRGPGQTLAIVGD